jgi:hypothetical protein
MDFLFYNEAIKIIPKLKYNQAQSSNKRKRFICEQHVGQRTLPSQQQNNKAG